MKKSWLLRPLRLAMELAITIALTLAWTPWVSPARAAVPGWENTGAMGTARLAHTATPLGNGKVLIAGGLGTSLFISSAELYDPGTGTFTPTGSMGTDRSGHTATLLGNGKVLIAGGVGTSLHRSSTEVFDPGTGTFTPTGSMGTARYGHTATLLGNGKVLIAGGEGPDGDFSSAEVYDPGTGKFTPTGSMGTKRSGTGFYYYASPLTYNTATLLGNGKVLIAGGENINYLFSSAELYDPGTGTFTPAGSMGTGRSVHTATLLGNGMVLIAGGQGPSICLSSAEIYLPVEVAAPTFSPAPGTYAAAQSVTISTTTSGATIRYTTDGSTPGETVGTVYSGLISVTGTMTIKAVAYKTGLTTSSVSTGAYTITSPGTSEGGGGGCSISPEGKSKGESPLGTMLVLLSPGILLVVRKTLHRKQFLS